jgi:thiol-disulfide isomerase/thioredoxin
MLIRIYVLIIAVLFLSGCSDNGQTSLENESQQKIKVDKKEPLRLQTLEDSTITVTKTDKGLKFEGHEDKVVLLNFFATWCPPCKAEIPHLNSLQASYGDTLSIISLALEEKSTQELQAFKDYYTINYTIAHGEPNYLLAELLGGVQTIPYMVLYDKDGNYATHYVGAVPEEMIDADIKKVLAK